MQAAPVHWKKPIPRGRALSPAERDYEEKPKEPKGNLAVPPFYCYRACDVKRIQEALNNGCGYDAPGSFAAWLSKQTPMHAYIMPGKRYDIGDINSYEYVKSVFSK